MDVIMYAIERALKLCHIKHMKFDWLLSCSDFYVLVTYYFETASIYIWRTHGLIANDLCLE